MPLHDANVILDFNHRRGRELGHYYGRGSDSHNSWNRDSHDPQNKLNYSERSSSKSTGPHSKQAYETDCYRWDERSLVTYLSYG